MTRAGHLSALAGALAALSLGLWGCAVAGSRSSPPAAEAAPTSQRADKYAATVVVDDLGREIAVDAPPEKIVSLSPGSTELLFALGLGEKVVGVTSYCALPPGSPEKTIVGGYTNPDVEKIVALAPDIVFAERGNLREILDALEKHGITYVGLEPESLDDLAHRTRLMATLTQTESRAEQLIAGWEETEDRVRRAVADVPSGARPRSLFVVSLDGLWIAGPDNYLHGMMELCGGENVAADAPLSWPQYSLEEVVARDPEVVFITADHSNPGRAANGGAEAIRKLQSDPRWAKVSAVKTGRICVLDADAALRPGPRAFEVLEEMARALHPDRFPERSGGSAPPSGGPDTSAPDGGAS